MKEKITKLIDLKSIITLMLAVALVIGFFMGMIEESDFILYVGMVFTYYFTRPVKKESDTSEL